MSCTFQRGVLGRWHMHYICSILLSYRKDLQDHGHVQHTQQTTSSQEHHDGAAWADRRRVRLVVGVLIYEQLITSLLNLSPNASFRTYERWILTTSTHLAHTRPRRWVLSISPRDDILAYLMEVSSRLPMPKLQPAPLTSSFL